MQAHNLIGSVGLLIFTKVLQNQTATKPNPVALRKCTHTDICCHSFDDDIMSFSSRGIPVTHSQSAAVKMKILIYFKTFLARESVLSILDKHRSLKSSWRALILRLIFFVWYKEEQSTRSSFGWKRNCRK